MDSHLLKALTYVSKLIKSFQAFDSDKNGLVNSVELQALLASLGHQTGHQEAKDIITLFASQNNQLSINEFLNTMNANQLGLGDLSNLFQVTIPTLGQAAQPGSLIDCKELAMMMSLIGTASVQDCMKIVSCLNRDNNGAISIEEVKLIATLF